TPAGEIRKLRDKLHIITLELKDEQQMRVSAENDKEIYMASDVACREKLTIISTYCQDHADEDNPHLIEIAALLNDNTEQVTGADYDEGSMNSS
ncbi:hypothetical protein, partial [Salmonella sp. s51228]|uniref:hypothetical protein n=1 Tax=Salmonella sp. s51228 TaxID=3159652 RepID=UPI003980FA7B